MPDSNSSLVLEALNRGLFEAIITESAFKEVYRYFRTHYFKRLADLFRLYVFAACRIVFSAQLRGRSGKYAGLVPKKDLEQLAAVRELGIKYLVSHDRDFQGLEEYVTPKQFVELLGMKSREKQY